MKKQLLCLALALALLAPLAQAVGDDLVLRAGSHLTEVYGYTQADADAFEFEEDGQGGLRFWHRDYPLWVYTLGNEPYPYSHTPFYRGNFPRYPGEAAIRQVLYKARENAWFENWTPTAMRALQQEMLAAGSIQPTLSLSYGLSNGDITAAQAVEEFFISCLGQPILWALSARQWRDEVLKSSGLQAEQAYVLPDGASVPVSQASGASLVRTEFQQNIPGFVRELFSHPQLSGWTCLGGVVNEHTDQVPEASGSGVIAFEKEGERLLVMLQKNKDRGWQLLPVSYQALHKGREIRLRGYGSSMAVRIEYPLGTDEMEVFTVLPYGLGQRGAALRLDSYQRLNHKTGELFMAQSTLNGWTLTTQDAQGVAEELAQPLAVIGFMEAITSLDDFPNTKAAWKSREGRLLPEGIAMLSGVHLRQETSSRSRDLGLMNPGTLISVLGYEAGDPHPWLKAQIGLKTGYVSTAYVNPPESQYGNASTFVSPLPVAKANKALALKSGTGLLDAKVTDLAQGSKMHVLCEQNGWLYVVVPRGEIGWLMDVAGTYGYVRPGDVTISATAIQADWISE